MRRILVKYDNKELLIDNKGLAPVANPLDEPMCIEVKKINNRFNVSFAYNIQTLEKYNENQSDCAQIKYGVISGKVSSFIELTEHNTEYVIENSFKCIEQKKNKRILMNLKFAKSLLHKLIVECNKQK